MRYKDIAYDINKYRYVMTAFILTIIAYLNMQYIKEYFHDTHYIWNRNDTVHQAVETKTVSKITKHIKTNRPVMKAMTKIKNTEHECKPETTSIKNNKIMPDHKARTEKTRMDSYIETAILFKDRGRMNGPSGIETYYDLSMERVVETMKRLGYTEKNGYSMWVRADGVKMYGSYVMAAADLNKYPRGTIVECTFGPAIICDTGSFTTNGSGVTLDIATAWKTMPINNI